MKWLKIAAMMVLLSVSSTKAAAEVVVDELQLQRLEELIEMYNDPLRDTYPNGTHLNDDELVELGMLRLMINDETDLAASHFEAAA